jgi:hypothetical protein
MFTLYYNKIPQSLFSKISFKLVIFIKNRCIKGSPILRPYDTVQERIKLKTEFLEGYIGDLEPQPL